ncbi:unnamed protein product [Brassicogethes aeneus]|uniref:DUF4806 domain-containing protein n=1 Tax=Brassicogethes aeneus TaxID=1431903 RepID=A0A9P0ATE9_BRAAE|nr:unnamed protein product [Brassicogethes aeneus]
MFKVIEFETGELEVVPTSWVKGDQVYWCKTARAYAKKNFDPKPSWKIYKCKTRYKNNTFATYEEASKKCNVLLYKTDSSETSSDDCRKKKNTQDSDYEYYKDIDIDIDDLPSLSPLSAADKTLTPEKLVEKEKSAADKILTSGKPVEKEKIQSIANAQPTNNVQTAVDVESTGFDNSDIINMANITFEPLCKCEEVKTLISSELNKFRSELKILNDAVNQNTKLIERFIIQSKREWETVKMCLQHINLEKPHLTVNPESEQLLQELIPVSSLDDLKILEEVLEEEDKKSYLIYKLKRIGGKDAKTTLSNIIKYCFTIEAQKKCNWIGANNKFSIKKTHLVSAIVQVLLETQNNITQSEIEQQIKYIFQHTYDRAKSGQVNLYIY